MLSEQLVHAMVLGRREAESGETVRRARRVEEADHGLLMSVAQGERRDPQVHHASIEAGRRATVLRAPSIGDVESRQHLEPTHHERRDVHRDAGHVVQDAVHAKADEQVVFLRFEMDVAGALVERVGDQPVERVHDHAAGRF